MTKPVLKPPTKGDKIKAEQTAQRLTKMAEKYNKLGLNLKVPNQKPNS